MSHTRLASLAALPAIAAALSGCATFMHGTTQEIPILSAPAGAQVFVDSAAVGRTPLSVQLLRSAQHRVRIDAAGYQPYEGAVGRRLSGWVWGNLLLSYFVIVGVPVDLLTGGLYNLQPDAIRASLTPLQDTVSSRDEPAQASAADRPRAISRLEHVVMVGSRARVSAAGGGAVADGMVTAVRGDTLELRTVQGQVPLVFPLDRVERLELGVGRKGHGGAGALVGVVAGGVLGWVVGSASYRPCTGWCFFAPGTREQSATIGAVFVGVAGAEVGLLIGAKITTEIWQPVPLDAIRLDLAPLPAGRLGVGATIRF